MLQSDIGDGSRHRRSFRASLLRHGAITLSPAVRRRKQARLSPCSDLSTEAVLGVYELNKIDLLKDVFIWAYERSAVRYVAVRQSLGEPDPFRLRHRAALRGIIGEVIRARMDRKAAAAYIANWVQQNMDAADRERFRGMAEDELLGLHEGNYARYEIRPAEFADRKSVV